MNRDTVPVLLWLRRELRLADNAALAACVATQRPVVPVFVLDDAAAGGWAPGGASRWWLHHSLAALRRGFARIGTPLVLRRGATATILRDVVRETGAVAVHAGQPIEPWARRQADALAEGLGVPLHLHRTATLFEPGTIRTRSGGAYGVFTAFARACRALGAPAPPLPAPEHVPAGPEIASDVFESWSLLPSSPDWSAGLRETWSAHGPGDTPGEDGAQRQLRRFTASALADYADSRNNPGKDGTSMLSPRLAWGEISLGQAWHAAASAHPEAPGTRVWTDELLWREFSAHLLWHHPDMPRAPLRPAFAGMPWRHDAAALRAWRRGRTGLPIVDAGMRQLWHTGWMHNRVRMIAASLLVKHLLLPWQEGERWFWDTLVDADLASNSAQWQWVAGCGADAAPFFRVFNPVLQGRTFDPDGSYVRRYVPELACLSGGLIHAPWEAPPLLLAEAGVSLGKTYPRPIVDLEAGRARAVAAFQALPVRAA